MLCIESKPVTLGQTAQTVMLTTSKQQGQGSVVSVPIGKHFAVH